MFFEFPLTIPANTPRTAPVTLPVTLAMGEVTWWELQFPAGCVGLVHVRVADETHQVIPANTDGNVSANGESVATFDAIEVTDKAGALQLEGWNDDDTFPHTVTFRFALRTQAELDKVNSAFRALDFLDRWFAGQLGVPAAAGGA